VDEGARELAGVEDAPVVLEGPLLGPEAGVGGGGRVLEREGHDPEHRDQRDEDDDDVGGRPARLLLRGGGHQLLISAPGADAPKTWRKTRARTATQKKMSTERAEPIPRFSAAKRLS